MELRSEGARRDEAPSQLIERARHDRSAFGELYDMYLRRVYAFCLAQSRDQQEAEDLTAQTFERALNAIDRYQDRGAPFSSWLFRIAANLATDRARRKGRLVLLGDDPVPEPRGGTASGSAPDPEQQVVQWERAAWIRAHMATLPLDQQRALRLRFWEGRSVAEVASQLDRSENATKQLLHRAMTTLRARVGGEAGSDARS